MWKSTVPTTMQEFGDYCKNMVQDNGNNGSSVYLTLIDTRDNNQYKVAKLKDGKCWMIENLKFGSNNQTTLLTPEKSDISSNYTLPKGSTSGFINQNMASFYLDLNNGGYYNWYAATAGTGTLSMTSGNAISSVCPKGWRLPTGGPDGEAKIMAQQYGNGKDSATSAALRKIPVPNFGLTGGYYNSQACATNEAGYFQTATAAPDGSSGSNYDSYDLYITSSNVVNDGHSHGSCQDEKWTGKSIRCVSQ